MGFSTNHKKLLGDPHDYGETPFSSIFAILDGIFHIFSGNSTIQHHPFIDGSHDSTPIYMYIIHYKYI